MILPIISSLTREVMTAVPHSQREAVLALGRHALGDDPHGRAAQCAHRHRRRHHSGPGPRAGRDHGRGHGHRQQPEIHRSLLANGSTMATVIANEFAEASAICI
jgi:phosphate transport system permease protein